MEMLALVCVILSWLALVEGDGPAYCDGTHAKLYTARPFSNEPITSPNYPLDYEPIGGACLWLIESTYLNDPNYILKVVFNDLELEGNTYSCRDADNIQFFDGPSIAYYSLGTYCGTSHPDVMYSTGQYLFVQFKAWNIHTYKYRGFSFNVSVVKTEEAATICRLPYKNVTSLSGSSGSFSSPGYPASYRNDALCIWTITVPAGKVVKLTFEDFYITMETTYRDCNFVEIRDSLSSKGRELARSKCHVKTAYFPPVVYSTGRFMWVKFHADYYYLQRQRDRGFKARFEAVNPVVDEELCLPGNPHNNLLNIIADKGAVMSPMMYYPPNLNCTWRITVPKGNIVYLTIKKLKLDRIDDCADYVEFFDGLSVSDHRITQYCGSSHPADVVRSSGPYMTISFVSDGKIHERSEGFMATFIADPEEPILPKSSDKGISTWKIGIITTVVASVALVLCMVCIAKKRKTRNHANNANNDVSIPMTTVRDTEPPSSPPGYLYPPDSPPPYPIAKYGQEEAPQYPPPGESYPWLQQSNTTSHPSV